jgi:hypothetical protein
MYLVPPSGVEVAGHWGERNDVEYSAWGAAKIGTVKIMEISKEDRRGEYEGCGVVVGGCCNYATCGRRIEFIVTIIFSNCKYTAFKTIYDMMAVKRIKVVFDIVIFKEAHDLLLVGP